MATEDHLLGLLTQMRREQNEGLESIHGKIEKVDARVEKMAEKVDEVRDDHADLRERLAKVEANDKRDAEERAWGPSGTGRYAVLPATGPVVVPTPPPGIAFSPHINIAGATATGGAAAATAAPARSNSKRPSRPPALEWLGKVSSSAAGKAAGLAIAACAGALVHLLATPAGPVAHLGPTPPPPPIESPPPTAMATTTVYAFQSQAPNFDGGSPPPPAASPALSPRHLAK